MKQFDKITIVGVGLIGGSIGLGIKKKHLAKEVAGVFRRNSTLKKALKRKAVDTATMSIADGVRGADLIILAAPVHRIPGLAREVMENAKEGAIITDAGSTKKWIVDSIEKIAPLFPGISFVGSHPMAGSEHAGVEFSRDDLLEGSPCIIAKTKNTEKKALYKVIRFWKALGANTKIMSPQEHDRRVAFISHLPHMVAFSLAGSVPVKDLPYAAEGFKDTTRVASSDANLWADIFLSNKKELLKTGHIFQKYLNDIMAALSNDNYSKTVKLLNKAKQKRDKFIYGKSS